MVWDSAGNSSYPTKYQRYADLAGNTYLVHDGKVTIGRQPILLSGDDLLSHDPCPSSFIDVALW